jgi:Flp pilus assembly protein TadG
MRLQSARPRRRGSILPFLAFSLVGLCGLVALAVDLGMVMVAKAQCQNAADAAALAGARTLDGSSKGNTKAATANATNTAKANTILGSPVQDADVTLVQHGAYHYDVTNQTFAPQFPPVSPDNYNLTQVTVTRSNGAAFARVFNLSAFTVQATAIAAHRPRDVSIVLDYSGSMNNESDLWNCESYLGNVNGTSNNSDPVYPQYGPYDTTFSPLAALQGTPYKTDPRIGLCNVSYTDPNVGVPPLVNDFYQNARGGAAIPAFYAAALPVTSTTPGGDVPLPKNGTTTPSLHCQDVMGGAGTGFPGYANYQGGTFYGYTQGPGYWGRTFFIWPPDPTTDGGGVSNDWRKRYFFLSDGTTPLNDNTKLFASNGVPNDPSGNYVINYKAILAWISAKCIQQTAGDGKPFPPTLRAGGILYYDGVPADVPASAYNHTTANSTITDANTRFWKEYIDYVLGVWRDPFGNVQHPGTPSCSYGPNFTAGSSTGGQFVQITGPDSATTPDAGGNPFINPTDNPKRPRHRMWFGPMTMIQYMSDTGLLPGTTHDVSMIAAKLGIQGALTDIQNNHPNDLVSLILFSRPHYNGEPAEVGAFSQAVTNLSRDYAGMINSLYFPPNSGTADVRPWDANGVQTPRAHGDYTANTATSYGFMLAYNQFSSSSTLRSSAVGGQGRKGAQRLIVLETDGMANQASSASFTSSGANSYYNVRPGDTVNASGSDPAQDALNVVQRIVALTTDTTNGPGFATPTKPVVIHCIAFGAIFEPNASGSEATNAMTFLQNVSALGGTGFPSSVTDTTSPYYYKLCIGNLQQRQDNMRTAFSKIMDDEVPIILVQ